MGEPACWGPFVPAPPPSTDGTASMIDAKSEPWKRGGAERRGTETWGFNLRTYRLVHPSQELWVCAP